MRNVTIKGLLSRRNRLALTMTAVVAGIAFLSAAGVLSATIRTGARDVFAETTENAEVEVRGAPAFEGDTSIDPTREPLEDSVLDTIRGVDGVAAAAGSVQGYAEIAGRDGNPVSNLAAQPVGASADGIGSVSPFELRSGRVPERDGEVMVDAATAEDRGLAVGDRVTILLTGPAEEFEVVGTVGFGDLEGAPGMSFTLFDLRTAQRLFGRGGQLDEVYVAAHDGVDPDELARRIAATVPHAEVVTSEERAAQRAREAASRLSIVDKGANAFAYIALAVAGFIIVNTFTIVIAQRSREFALLRALGASRRQVRWSVIAEAAVTGLLASAVGTGIGIGLATGLRALIERTGVELPGDGVVVETTNIVVPIVVGVALSIAAGYLPARRASSVAPLEAMRELPTPRRIRAVRYVTGGLLTAAGMTLGLLGVPLLLVGVALLSPLLVPVAGVLGGWCRTGCAGRRAGFVAGEDEARRTPPANPRAEDDVQRRSLAGETCALPFGTSHLARLGRRFQAVPTRLGHDNAVRNPRRTAATASALMIGLALVVGLTIAADSGLATFGRALDKGVTADYIVDSDRTPLSPDLADRLQARPEIALASGMGAGEFQLGQASSVEELSAIDPATIGEVSDLGYSDGALERLADGGVLVSQERARKEGWQVGDVLAMRFAGTGVQSITIDGTYADDTLENQGFLLSRRDFEANYPDRLDVRVLVSGAAGVPAPDVRAAVEDVVRAFPNARVQSNDEYKAAFRDRLDIALAIVAAILGIAVLIAVIGIVNTLALSIVERTHELGVLRAIGMTRRQVRKMVRAEAVSISVLGGVLGVLVGAQVGVTVARLLEADQITFPWLRLALLLVLAVIASLGGAILPARRAARLDVLTAVGAT